MTLATFGSRTNVQLWKNGRYGTTAKPVATSPDVTAASHHLIR